jgi:hypothetical protein
MASIPNNGYAEVMSGSNNYTGSNSFDGSCPQTAIAPVVANDLCNKLYVDTTATGGGNPTITDTNTNATYYPVFVAGSGVQPLLADITTTTTSINPSNGNFSVVDTLKLTQDTVSIGKSAGIVQAGNTVAIGASAGGNQSAAAVAVGTFAGNGSQGAAATAIGFASGYSSQGASTTAIGGTAGNANQGNGATAVGYGAGTTGQGNSATAVGIGAGGSGQGNDAVAIGAGAGSTNQGANAIAIGVAAGITSQTAGSICLNASGAALNPSVAGCFINPIRGVALGIGVGRVFYNTTTFELQYSTT